jgi:uncharacterized membrane protein
MDGDRAEERYERTHDPSRVLAFSDGVCAIIITLLVIEIHPPTLGNGETLQDAIGELRPSLIAFAISFVVVAIAWVGHRDLFALIRRTDRGLVWLNVLYLFPLCLVPFGASLIASYQDDPVALRLYGFLLVAVAVTRLCIWVYATGRPLLLVVPIDPRSRRLGIAVALGPGATYALAVMIAPSSPTASLLIYGAVPVVYFIAITIARSSAPPGAAERDFT